MFLINDKNKVWKFQILFLVAVCVIELTGRYYRIVIEKDNSWVYNFYLLAEIGFVSTFFYFLFDDYRSARLYIICAVIVFIVVYIIELYLHGITNFNVNSDTLLSVHFCICSLLYYYQLLKSDKYEKLSKLPSFWWVNGSLFFYFGSVACDLFFYQLFSIPKNLRSDIYVILNLLLYGSWTYAFLCRYLQRKQLNLSLQQR
ncbi:hypothetical protein GWR56_05175 [Mucilaginibacter sp. 14171R-50]|uniref:hypothetical protein n=1 Tax=Mucilaginibacter sp. 14171R-50 TaxID=2703789 RepID=UPI00138BA3D6|nr:hypothetical protein [Mucilaginibacter sp. 14171R-50]QHS54960.1 hypothetical protein GWR56_05175 [Mucilaginibacter sp. 14171R-50]